ncbi:DUF4236 domain-containing protein [Sinomicrobium sp. M5D2P9]
MAINFRKRKKILPGIYLNFSKNGISTTLGPRGANVNLGKNGAYLNTGIPGTGIYSRRKIGGTNGSNPGITVGDGIPKNHYVTKSYKTKTTTIVLALLLGTFGAHHFYLRQYWRGVLSLLFFWTLFPTFTSFIDIIIFVAMPKTRFDQKYNGITTAPIVKHCSGCGTPLTFTTTPNFGGGKLKDGGQVCRDCFGKIANIDKGFGMHSSHKYDTNLVRQFLSGKSVSALSFVALNAISGNTSIASSPSLDELKTHIQEARQERQELKREIMQQQSTTKQLEQKLKSKQSGISKFFIKPETIKKLQTEVKEGNEYLTDLYGQYEESQADINIESDKEFREQYQVVKETYMELSKADKIWDIVSERATTETKSAAKTSIDRKEVSYTLDNIDFILCEHPAFHLENADGDNLYIYPAFLLQVHYTGEITLIDLRELRFRFHRQRFLEEESTIPSDSHIIDYTWAKVNKDGSPDRRFVGNYQIPVVEYGAFEFSTNSGLKEVYYISNIQLAEKFANEFRAYLSLLSPIRGSDLENTTDFNGMGHYDFSYSYYTLLKDFSGSLLSLIQKLQTDEVILQRIGTTHSQTKIRKFIANCVVYDMIQASNILAEGKLATRSLEATGLVLATGQLLSDNEGDMLGQEFNIIALAHQKGLYEKVARELVNMATTENPIRIAIRETEDDKVTSSTKIQNNLCFPSFLKLTENQLFEEYATVLYRYAIIISKADNVVTKKEEKLLKNIYKLTHNPVEKQSKALHITKSNDNETLDEVLQELNDLIGLHEVKAEINTLINFIKVQKARERSGLQSSSISCHIVFTGNPGTGKTTVARIVARIYKHLGILTGGHLVETDRSGLVAGYTGQTAVKVNNTVNSALSGILFIDEAYALVGENKDDFGKEAVATLIKRMEDERDKLVVVLAGYPGEMANFIETNPGFKSRFNRYIHFPDYTPGELYDIFMSKCQKLDYYLTEEATTKLKMVLETAYVARDKSFGNGRFVRNVFEKTLEQQANRIAREPNLTKEILTTITDTDIRG